MSYLLQKWKVNTRQRERCLCAKLHTCIWWRKLTEKHTQTPILFPSFFHSFSLLFHLFVFVLLCLFDFLRSCDCPQERQVDMEMKAIVWGGGTAERRMRRTLFFWNNEKACYLWIVHIRCCATPSNTIFVKQTSEVIISLVVVFIVIHCNIDVCIYRVMNNVGRGHIKSGCLHGLFKGK